MVEAGALTFDPTVALIVVDIQNDFADPEGSLYVAGGEEILPELWARAGRPDLARDTGLRAAQSAWQRGRFDAAARLFIAAFQQPGPT